MPPEITNRRPTNYSRWHRPPTLPDWCFQVDGDWFEMRKRNDELVPVACIETIEIRALFLQNAQREYPLWEAKRALLREIRQRMNIPVFVVRHTPDCKSFSVARLTNSGEETESSLMGEDEYKDLLQHL